jgi:hypothetical protein
MKKCTFFFACAWVLAFFAHAQQAMALPEFSSDKGYLVKHVASGKFLLLHDKYSEILLSGKTFMI